jgi:hypothetical protein
MKLMVKEESTDKKEEEAKRINFILWGIGNRLSSLGVIASSEWDVGDKLDLEHPEKQFLEVNLDPSIYITYDGEKTFYIAPYHNYFLFGEKVSGASLEAATSKLTGILSARLAKGPRILGQVKRDLIDFGLAKPSDIAIKGDTLTIKAPKKEDLPSAIRFETYEEETDTGVNFYLTDREGNEAPVPGNPGKNQFLASSKLLTILAKLR